MSESVPDFVDKLNIYALSDALFMLNGALDRGKASDVTCEEVHRHLESGDLVEFLQHRLGVQFSGARPGVEQNKYFVEALRSVRDTIGGRERRKFGVENNGACMLIAYITEIIQSGMWDIASLKMYGQPG
jgi:hypothetical protein